MVPRALLRLRQWLGRLSAAAATAALVCGASAGPAPAAHPPVIQEITWRDFGLVLKASAPLDPEIFTLDHPARFVLDLPQAEFAEPQLARTIRVASGPVERVRLDQKSEGVRLVVDCKTATRWQVIQVGDRSTLLLVRAGQSHPDLKALLQRAGRYAGYGQDLRTVWARESGNELKVHLGSVKPLTYSLFATDGHHLSVRIPAGHYPSLLPRTGKWLKGIEAKTEAGVYNLNLTLAAGQWQLKEESTRDRSGLTLAFERVDPWRFPKRPLVVIDPGHGGNDPGALGPDGVTEKAVCLALAHELQAALAKKRINAVLTRSADVELLLAPRLELIDQLDADLFVSLHANSHTGPDVTGIETYWRNAPSEPLAVAVQQSLTRVLKRPDRGVKQERLYVIRNPRVPSVLVETGFISNPAEERLLADRSFQQNAAAAIVSGIEGYLATPPLARGL